MKFSEDIRKIRKSLFMSQTDFAAAVGVTFVTVNRWENGKTLPGYKAMKTITEFCKERGIEFNAANYDED